MCPVEIVNILQDQVRFSCQRIMTSCGPTETRRKAQAESKDTVGPLGRSVSLDSFRPSVIFVTYKSRNLRNILFALFCSSYISMSTELS